MFVRESTTCTIPVPLIIYSESSQSTCILCYMGSNRLFGTVLWQFQETLMQENYHDLIIRVKLSLHAIFGGGNSKWSISWYLRICWNPEKKSYLFWNFISIVSNLSWFSRFINLWLFYLSYAKALDKSRLLSFIWQESARLFGNGDLISAFVTYCLKGFLM